MTKKIDLQYVSGLLTELHASIDASEALLNDLIKDILEERNTRTVSQSTVLPNVSTGSPRFAPATL